jgi:hypothetical protein
VKKLILHIVSVALVLLFCSNLLSATQPSASKHTETSSIVTIYTEQSSVCFLVSPANDDDERSAEFFAPLATVLPLDDVVPFVSSSLYSSLASSTTSHTLAELCIFRI